jgi:alcohol dehydrogenase, propanol-preferring
LNDKLTRVNTAAAGTVSLGVDPSRLIFKNGHIIGTLVGTMKDTASVLEFARRGLLRPIYMVYSIDQLPEAVEKLRKGQIAGRAVIDFNI